LAAGFEVFLAVVEADLALVPVPRFEPPDFDALFLAPPDLEALFFAPLDFDALFVADFAALFLAPPAFAAPFFAALFLAPPAFAAPFDDALPPDFEPEVFDDVLLLLALAFVEEVLESPMALPAASFILVMAD
jgi:hypothetical protein